MTPLPPFKANNTSLLVRRYIVLISTGNVSPNSSDRCDQLQCHCYRWRSNDTYESMKVSYRNGTPNRETNGFGFPQFSETPRVSKKNSKRSSRLDQPVPSPFVQPVEGWEERLSIADPQKRQQTPVVGLLQSAKLAETTV